MTWSEKLRLFFKEMNLTNREVCRRMDNYSEPLLSRQLSAEEPNGTLLMAIGKYFPEADLNYIVKTDAQLRVVEEKATIYSHRGLEIMNEIEGKFLELKEILSPK